jgi:hypothetical protein
MLKSEAEAKAEDVQRGLREECTFSQVRSQKPKVKGIVERVRAFAFSASPLLVAALPLPCLWLCNTGRWRLAELPASVEFEQGL